MDEEKLNRNVSVLIEYHDISIEVCQSRFASAKTVPGTQKYHSLISSSELTLMLRKFSSQLTFFQRN